MPSTCLLTLTSSAATWSIGRSTFVSRDSFTSSAPFVSLLLFFALKTPPSSAARGKETLYLMTHSTHFFNAYIATDIMVKDHSDNEGKRRNGNILFNDTLSTLYYGYIVSDIW